MSLSGVDEVRSCEKSNVSGVQLPEKRAAWQTGAPHRRREVVGAAVGALRVPC